MDHSSGKHLVSEYGNIPTTYKGVRFRSRVEARWAVMFDRFGWPWEYEPFDLYGYIPDFVIPFEHRPLLVEVKADIEIADLYKPIQKAIRSGWDGEILVVGGRVFNDTTIGVIAERFQGEACPDQASAFGCISCGNLSVLCEGGAWRCRWCGVDDGNGHVSWLDTDEIHHHWAEAGKRVQWRGDRAVGE